MTPHETWIADQFDRCWPWLESAVRKMRQPYGKEYCWRRIVDETAQLWPGTASAILAQIDTQEDGQKILVGWLAGGDRAEIERNTALAENWAKKQGCVKVRAVQRLGFKAKPLPGYRAIALLVEKDL